ncbi:MAG: GYF domain-containing protein [Polyangia bacterium]
MKIVCDACQAKYSIADEKVQGKAFKIRCKKCNHIIVVRSGGEKAAGAAAEPKPAPAEAQGAWYVVVEGEQMGPLAEPDIAARLARGEITGESLVWKEGLADWVKLSSVPELAQVSSPQATPGAQRTAEPAPVRRSSAAMRAHGSSREAPVAAAPSEDIFSKPAPAADLFASPAVAHSSAASEAPATASAAFAFGGVAAPAPEPATRTPGNGAGESHMTGQRNENSVLFSLANLEALAVPSSSTSARAPSTTSTTEGSGLIDIRSMAARTIGESGREDAFGGSDSLPTFSTPQFSPVAPVFLPMASSGPPKWVYPVLGVLGLGIVALGFGIYKVVSVPPLPPPAPPQIVVPAPVPAPAPAAAAAPTPGAPAAAQPAKPAVTEEKPSEEKATEKKKSSGRGGKSSARAQSESASSAKGAQPAPEPVAAPAPAPAPAKPKKGGSIDDLLDQVNTNRRGGDEPKPKKVITAAALPSLSQSDIVSAMKAVQPRVKECYNQYKVAGIANVSISISKGGRVASATVTGKFAGTPSGTCVEAAAKTAKFPPCEAMSFPWPFQLH